MKIEVHLIQNFAPSCLNRDDTNTPKDCEFGGVRRARISSQCFKRAMRSRFRETGSVPVGERTKLLKSRLLEKLQGEITAPELSHAIDAFIEAYYSKMDDKSQNSTAVLLFLSPQEIEAAAEAVRGQWEKLQPTAKALKEIDDLEKSGTKRADAEKKVKVPPYKSDKSVNKDLESAGLSTDIALFGRMLASDSEAKLKFNKEASCQVAQAISTHAVNPETDFYSAVDDLQKDHSGAGMLGVTGFNSACFYRYALLDFDALQKNLDGDQNVARQSVEAFLRSAIEAIPTGKQNSMAAQNPPSLGLFVVRDGGMPLSLANAFVAPVSENENGGLVEASVARLGRYWDKFTTVYGDDGIRATPWFCLEDNDPSSLDAAQKTSVKGAIAAVMAQLPGGTMEASSGGA